MYWTNHELADALGEDIKAVASMMRRMWVADEVQRRSPPARPDCKIPYLWTMGGPPNLSPRPEPLFRWGNDRRSLARRAARYRGRAERPEIVDE
jgi:hypothetical protein